MTKGFRWNALRDWIKVARDLPRTRGSYPDGPIVALVFAFCKAAEQAEPGTFDSLPVLRAILDATGNKRGRWVPFLVEKGDVVVLPDGRATLPNWRTFQEEGTSTERVRKHRANKRDGVTGNGLETFHGTVMERLAGAPPRRDTPHGVENTFGVRALSGETTRADDVFTAMQAVEDLTGRPFGWGSGSPIFETLAADVRDLGVERVTTEYRAVRAAANGNPIDPAGIVFGAHKRLFPIPDAPRTAKAGKGGVSAEEAERAFGA